MLQTKRPVLLIINDGWGIAPPGEGNYISQANTPFFNHLMSEYPHAANLASGNAVGLPDGSQGNSEVGHLHLGAGRIVWQMLENINHQIREKTFFSQPVLLNAMDKAKGSALHLIGLCSDEGIHAHIEHLKALLEVAAQQQVKNVSIHFIADGRDVAEKSALIYVKQIKDKCQELGIGRIVSVMGRYYGMDRDNNWDRTQKAYDLLTQGIGHPTHSPEEAIEMAYKRGDKTDYYIEPSNVEPFTPITDDDVVICFNFRTDRLRQLVRALTWQEFDYFPRSVFPHIHCVTLTQYDKSFQNPYVFQEITVAHNLASILAEHGMKQLRLAETEKYGHVTYFFNSQIEQPYPGEDRVMIRSVKVPSYDLQPEMSAREIAAEAVKQIRGQKYDFILINFANCDLVGHSGIKEAIIQAVEIVDDCNAQVVAAGLEHGYTIFITADHGNAEDKLYADGSVKPSHSTNPVNFICVSNRPELQKIQLRSGGQEDVAPTILEVMGLPKPQEMTGKSLIKQ